MNNKYKHRKGIISAMVIAIALIYIIRLFLFQLVDDQYKDRALNNSLREEIQYPARGLVYDRNGKLLVDNQAAYDLIMLPRQVKVFDTTELLTILGITKSYLEKRIAECKAHSRYKPSILIPQIAGDKFAVLQEKLYRYPGFYIQTRTMRKYNVNHSGGLFGYLSEVSDADITNDRYYTRGDYIGKTGLEKTFEEVLRGKKGKKVFTVDNLNRIKGSYQNGAVDEDAVVGENLHTTLDIELQEYAVLLMSNKKGGIVAIEPATGEILAKVSSPGYDPNFMLGLDRGKNYSVLLNDSLRPLFDRTTSAQYPPGSIFKPLMALVGLQTGAITPATQFNCNRGAHVGRFMGCHAHKSPLNLKESITHSCNPYFANVLEKILTRAGSKSVREAYVNWREHLLSFGLSNKVSQDFYEERSGSIPTADYYDRVYHRWAASTINSIAIGQGEIDITPLQMVNMAAAIANRGFYYSPHIVRGTTEELKQRIKRHQTMVDPAHFEVVIEGMKGVIQQGTGRRAQVDSIVVAGKTGTVQNPPYEDHSVFIAFAPADDPKIALAIYVENGGWGSSYAAPMAGLLIEKYLKKEISPQKKAVEKQIVSASLLNPSPKKKN